MKSLIPLVLLFLLSFAIKAQDYKEVRFGAVDALLQTKDDTLYVVNFWATWCKPCVAELPYFEKLHELGEGAKFKVILISLDFQHEIETKFKPFLEERKLKSEVWYLNERKFNKFIPTVEEGWSGALPFTLIFRAADDFRYWKEGAFKKDELEALFTSNIL